MVINHKLRGERLYLRSIKKNDVNANYVNWMNDEDVNKFLETRFVKQDLQSIITFIEDKNISTDEYLLGIFENNGGHIGNIKIGPIRSYHSLAEASIFIGEKLVWGRGYASESINIATNFAFENLKLRKLTASMYKDNIGSIQAFLNSGWSIEANLPNHYIMNAQEIDITIMGIRS